MVTFPTSSTALIQLKDGDYNIIQLAKTVDQAVKAQAEARGESVAKDKDADGEGGEDFAAGQREYRRTFSSLPGAADLNSWQTGQVGTRTTSLGNRGSAARKARPSPHAGP